ncbi:hypothetical protein [Parasphingorhabdus sp.]|uniref:hypothetical protein n=1 Tax=Parasphingorhabdus sp. TaxID=2709688 RepID=UPI003D2BD257
MERYLAVATGRCKTHSRLFNSSVVLSMDLIHFRTMDLIKIAPYDPSWIAKFAAEKQRLQEHLSNRDPAYARETNHRYTCRSGIGG